MSSNTLLIVLPTDLRIVEQANSEVAIMDVVVVSTCIVEG
jgi:hypothetical protein